MSVFIETYAQLDSEESGWKFYYVFYQLKKEEGLPLISCFLAPHIFVGGYMYRWLFILILAL